MESITDQEKQEYEANLRWRLEVLKAKLEAGEVHISSDIADGIEQSLKAVRSLPDGQIDLDTVDGRVRSMALAAAHVHNREQDKKSISLIDVSRTYFDFVELNCGDLARQAKEHGLNAHQFAMALSRDVEAVTGINKQLPQFLEVLENFWRDAADAVHYHVQDLQGTKAVYGGDLFPSYEQNLASSVGLYTDTIVLSDPFWHSRHVFDMASPERRVYYFAKHAINVLGYRDMALADLEKPIVVFAPFRSSVDDAEEKFLKHITEVDGLKHAAHVFGRSFENVEDLFDYARTLSTPELAVEALADPSRLVFDTEWGGSKLEQVRRSLGSEWSPVTGDSNAGLMIAGQCLARMGQATDILLKSRYLMGTPLIDAPTSWKYFSWKLEYNSALDDDDRTHLHMVRGLQHAREGEAQWLGKIPPAALIEMRKVGAFEEIRTVLSAGVDDIARERPTAYFRSSDKIVENIRDAFDRHGAEVKKLTQRKIKFAGFDIGSLVAVGAVEIAAAITGTPLFGVGAYAATQLIDAPTIRQIPAKFRDLRNAHVELKKSPMGLLFKHKK
ncbi:MULTISPECIES: hypothetical protein [unclassified Rhizobium]|uniref:hypothetical protein n=1 Tax=unclassified Rhizobium TaxID=2613769 RepID=UPI001ADB1E36|nr:MULTISPECIES: hypothetical protein [unclassified Rhizobium]MBO9124827.1 hypothetical protein [Rhizobium sp. 16-488-2b]MBO9175411.1 hypothetical protein [Rhizobium sp. 16-488-2a]